MVTDTESVVLTFTLIHPVSRWTHRATLRRHSCLLRTADLSFFPGSFPNLSWLRLSNLFLASLVLSCNQELPRVMLIVVYPSSKQKMAILLILCLYSAHHRPLQLHNIVTLYSVPPPLLFGRICFMVLVMRKGGESSGSGPWLLLCTLEVFHVHSYQDQFIQPGWAECFFVYLA